MNKAEVAQVLTMIAAFDRRTLGEADVEAWHLILENVEQPDAMQAVRDHFGQSTEWLMPAHVVERARSYSDRRLGEIRQRELAAAREAENNEYLRLVAAGQVEPFDREAFKRQLQAGSLKGGNSVPKVDRRGDETRRAEARRELDEARKRQEGEAS